MSEKPANAQTSPQSAASSSRRGLLVVCILMAAYAALYITLCAVKWRFFLYQDFDMPIYAQSAWMIMHGSLYSSILGVNLLGNHMSLLMIPIAPIYAVFPYPMTLLVLQTVVLALGALPVYWMAKREIGNDWIAVCLAALYLMYPALGYTNLYEFHPETLATTFLLYAFYYLWVGRMGWMIVFAVLALLCKEDVPIVVGAMGLYALLIQRPKRWVYSAALVALAVAFLVLAFGIVMPAVNKGEVQLEKIYGHWGPTTGQALVGMAKDPVRAIGELFSTPNSPIDTAVKHELYWQLLLPVVFLALLSPLTLAIALPAFAQHMLSARLSDHSLVYHYTSYFTPFVMMATVLGLRNLLRWIASEERKGTVGLVVCGVALVSTITCNFLFGPVVGSGVMLSYAPSETHWPTPYEQAVAPYMRDMAAQVPAKGAVAVGFRFMGRVIDRPDVYSVHHIYKGTYTMSDKPYPVPDNVVALLVDTSENLFFGFTRDFSGGRMRDLLEKNRLVPADSAGDALLFLRDTTREPVKLYETGAFTPEYRRRVGYNNQLNFLGSDRLPQAASVGGRVPIVTCWTRVGRVDRFYDTQFCLVDDAGNYRIFMFRRICYSFYPPHDWPDGAVVREHYNLVVPTDVKPGTYGVGVRLLQEVNGFVLAPPDDSELAKTAYFIPLGKIVITGAGR